MAIGVFAALAYVSHQLAGSDVGVLVALYFIVLQFVIITALALFFSSFSTPIFSAIFAFWLFVIGNFAQDLRNFAAMTHGLTRWLATGAAYLVPNFSTLNVITQVAHGEPVPSQLILINTGYALVYSVAVLSAAVLIFERRNLK
jgi:ABC-type transport system involved in multi-copper enzyme maturation permease subunit